MVKNNIQLSLLKKVRLIFDALIFLPDSWSENLCESHIWKRLIFEHIQLIRLENQEVDQQYFFSFLPEAHPTACASFGGGFPKAVSEINHLFKKYWAINKAKYYWTIIEILHNHELRLVFLWKYWISLEIRRNPLKWLRMKHQSGEKGTFSNAAGVIVEDLVQYWTHLWK